MCRENLFSDVTPGKRDEAGRVVYMHYFLILASPRPVSGNGRLAGEPFTQGEPCAQSRPRNIDNRPRVRPKWPKDVLGFRRFSRILSRLSPQSIIPTRTCAQETLITWEPDCKFSRRELTACHLPLFTEYSVHSPITAVVSAALSHFIPCE